jgi:hypothetical protein
LSVSLAGGSIIIQSSVSTVETIGVARILFRGVLRRELSTLLLELQEEDVWLHSIPAEQQEAVRTQITK